MSLWATHREQHHGDGERDGGQHGQAHDQQDDVSLVHLGVSMQQLRLHAHYTGQEERKTQRERDITSCPLVGITNI